MSDSAPPPHVHSIGDSLHHLGESLPHLHLPHMHGHQSVVRDVNAEHQQSMTMLDRIALKINDYCGSMVTFLLVLGYEIVWCVGVAIGIFKFDSLPNLPLLLVLLNLPQLPLMFALMVSGNMLNKHSELRAEADFAVNTKAEAQIHKLIEISNFQTEQILAIVKRLEGDQSLEGTPPSARQTTAPSEGSIMPIVSAGQVGSAAEARAPAARDGAGAG